MNLHQSMHLVRKSIALGGILSAALVLGGCSSIKAPDLSGKLAMPEFRIAENEPTFRNRLYAGASVGTSTLKPDTSGTVFNVENSKSQASQLRIGMDLHNQFAVELDTSILGQADLVEGGTNVRYTSASVSALMYGLTGVRNRSSRTGFSGFGRVGYSLIQRASAVVPLDRSDSGVFLGIGAEYGFKNGMALRAELTRLSSDATVMGFGGVYRFGTAPKRIARMFADAAKPALQSGSSQVGNGRMLSGDQASVSESSRNFSTNRGSGAVGTVQSLSMQRWEPKITKHDLDGDGVKNKLDACKKTAPRTTVNAKGCGMFDAVLSNVTFKSGSSWLTPRARGELDRVAATLLMFPEARVQVRAHTDSDGPADLNLGLSARRAESVVAYFIDKGVGETQLETLGLGESQPLDSNETPEGKKRNRRIELLTLPNLEELNVIDPTMLAEKPVDVVSSEAAAKTVAAGGGASFGEPVFPPMSGVKIEALPQSEFVPGLGLGGLLEGVQFRDGSATLTGDSKSVLSRVSKQLKRHPNVRLVVMGHTDNQRPPEESKSLSAKRANAIVNHLVQMGIDSSRLSAEGFGSSLPVAQNLTDADRRRNERIELRVLK